MNSKVIDIIESDGYHTRYADIDRYIESLRKELYDLDKKLSDLNSDVSNKIDNIKSEEHRQLDSKLRYERKLSSLNKSLKKIINHKDEKSEERKIKLKKEIEIHEYILKGYERRLQSFQRSYSQVINIDLERAPLEKRIFNLTSKIGDIQEQKYDADGYLRTISNYYKSIVDLINVITKEPEDSIVILHLVALHALGLLDKFARSRSRNFNNFFNNINIKSTDEISNYSYQREKNIVRYEGYKFDYQKIKEHLYIALKDYLPIIDSISKAVLKEVCRAFDKALDIAGFELLFDLSLEAVKNSLTSKKKTKKVKEILNLTSETRFDRELSSLIYHLVQNEINENSTILIDNSLSRTVTLNFEPKHDITTGYKSDLEYIVLITRLIASNWVDNIKIRRDPSPGILEKKYDVIIAEASTIFDLNKYKKAISNGGSAIVKLPVDKFNETQIKSVFYEKNEENTDIKLECIIGIGGLNYLNRDSSIKPHDYYIKLKADPIYSYHQNLDPFVLLIFNRKREQNYELFIIHDNLLSYDTNLEWWEMESNIIDYSNRFTLTGNYYNRKREYTPPSSEYLKIISDTYLKKNTTRWSKYIDAENFNSLAVGDYFLDNIEGTSLSDFFEDAINYDLKLDDQIPKLIDSNLPRYSYSPDTDNEFGLVETPVTFVTYLQGLGLCTETIDQAGEILALNNRTAQCAIKVKNDVLLPKYLLPILKNLDSSWIPEYVKEELIKSFQILKTGNTSRYLPISHLLKAKLNLNRISEDLEKANFDFDELELVSNNKIKVTDENILDYSNSNLDDEQENINSIKDSVLDKYIDIRHSTGTARTNIEAYSKRLKTFFDNFGEDASVQHLNQLFKNSQKTIAKNPKSLYEISESLFRYAQELNGLLKDGEISVRIYEHPKSVIDVEHIDRILRDFVNENEIFKLEYESELINSTAQISGNVNLIKLMIRTLLDNAKEHAFENKANNNSTVHISLRESRKAIILKYEDNGCGFKDGFSKKDFITFGKTSTNDKRKGRGGDIINSISIYHGNPMWKFETNIGHSSVLFEFNFPKI